MTQLTDEGCDATSAQYATRDASTPPFAPESQSSGTDGYGAQKRSVRPSPGCAVVWVEGAESNAAPCTVCTDCAIVTHLMPSRGGQSCVEMVTDHHSADQMMLSRAW